MILGTAAYMAPEQAQGQAGRQAGRHLGVRLRAVQMLTGARAFKGEDLADTLRAVVHPRSRTGGCCRDDRRRGLPFFGAAWRRICENRLHDIGDTRLDIGGRVRRADRRRYRRRPVSFLRQVTLAAVCDGGGGFFIAASGLTGWMFQAHACHSPHQPLRQFTLTPSEIAGDCETAIVDDEAITHGELEAGVPRRPGRRAARFSS